MDIGKEKVQLPTAALQFEVERLLTSWDIIMEINERSNNSTRYRRDGREGFVTRTCVPEDLPLLREAVEEAACFFREKNFIATVEESSNEKPGVPATLWHIALELSWIRNGPYS